MYGMLHGSGTYNQAKQRVRNLMKYDDGIQGGQPLDAASRTVEPIR